jgi:D-amino-acid dehydrogenase
MVARGDRSQVLVIGGGVVGLCVAWALVDEDVTVVDRGGFGQAASQGNAGWVTTSLAGPLPAPGVVSKGLRWMLRPDSPLLVRPQLDREFVRWIWHFARNCRPDVHATGTRAVLALGKRTQQAYADLVADEVSFESHRTGLIMAARTEKGLVECEALRGGLTSAGYGGALTTMSGRDARSLEPSFGEAVVGGLYAHDDWHVAPESLCAGLVERLRGRGTGLLASTRVSSLTRESEAWRVELEGRPPVYADQVVVACGAWSKPLLDQAGFEILLEPAKGYSITGHVGNPPRHAVYMLETKVGCTPFDRTTRLAGTLELAGLDERLRRRRLASVARSPKQYFRQWGLHEPRAWAGFRPATPDGLPYIGAVPSAPGLFVATGHNMLGITLAPATGVALAQAMHGAPAPVLAPFRPDRSMS